MYSYFNASIIVPQPKLEAQPSSGPSGTGLQVEARRGEEWFDEWWRKDVT